MSAAALKALEAVAQLAEDLAGQIKRLLPRDGHREGAILQINDGIQSVEEALDALGDE